MRSNRSVLAGAAAFLLLGIAACGAGPDEEPAAAPASAAVTESHAGHAGAPAAASSPLRAGERFVDVGLTAPYTPAAPGGGTDEYRCFLVDPQLTETAYLTGSRFLPQNAAIVHHAIFYRVDPRQAREAAEIDARAAGEGWTCFGDSGVQGQTAWVAHWAPGAGETLMPDGFGFTMPPGSKLIMQVHYNLLNTTGSDSSGMQMRLAPADAGLRPLETSLVMAPIELPCEPGGGGPLCDRETAVADLAKRFGAESAETVEQLNRWCNGGRKPRAGTTGRCDQPVQQAGTVYMAAGHMHLLGRSIKVELNPGTPAARTVLDVPAYDFDNQALVPLKEPIGVAKGDVIRVTCTHDAGLRERLPQLRSLPSRYVVWGEGTSDEMCLGVLVMAPAS